MLLGKENINFTNSDLAKMMKSINKIYIPKQSKGNFKNKSYNFS